MAKKSWIEGYSYSYVELKSLADFVPVAIEVAEQLDPPVSDALKVTSEFLELITRNVPEKFPNVRYVSWKVIMTSLFHQRLLEWTDWRPISDLAVSYENPQAMWFHEERTESLGKEQHNLRVFLNCLIPIVTEHVGQRVRGHDNEDIGDGIASEIKRMDRKGFTKLRNRAKKTHTVIKNAHKAFEPSILRRNVRRILSRKPTEQEVDLLEEFNDIDTSLLLDALDVKNRFTVRELAEKLGVSKTMMNRVLKGDQPNEELAKAIRRMAIEEILRK